MNIPALHFQPPDENTWSPGNEIHVWRWPVVPGEFYLLTHQERQIADKFRFAPDRLRFSVGRHHLRWLLSKYTGAAPDSISFSSLPGGKPFLLSPSGNIHFNVSHSGQWVLIGLANRAIGIDVEEIDPGFQFAGLLDDYFSEAEKSYIWDSENQSVAFYYLWTRKEALVKAWGTGLQENMQLVSVMDGEIVSRSVHWQIQTLPLSENYQAAVACQEHLTSIICLEGSQ